MKKGVDPQETFDICANHLRTQKQKSIVVINGCINSAYRGLNNLKSPVGVLLGEHYLPQFESHTIEDSLIRWILEKQLGHKWSLCLSFEKLHTFVEPAYWENEIQCIATIHNLNYFSPVAAKPIPDDPIIGFLSCGKFVAKDYAQHIPQIPPPIPIHLSHIGNYSQICSISKKVVVDGLKSEITGKPICLFQH